MSLRQLNREKVKWAEKGQAAAAVLGFREVKPNIQNRRTSAEERPSAHPVYSSQTSGPDNTLLLLGQNSTQTSVFLILLKWLILKSASFIQQTRGWSAQHQKIRRSNNIIHSHLHFISSYLFICTCKYIFCGTTGNNWLQHSNTWTTPMKIFWRHHCSSSWVALITWFCFPVLKLWKKKKTLPDLKG